MNKFQIPEDKEIERLREELKLTKIQLNVCRLDADGQRKRVSAAQGQLGAVAALGWKWHEQAVKDGFAASEPAQELFELLAWPEKNAKQVGERAAAEARTLKAVEAIISALQNYERFGAVCEFEGQPMIYASTLEEIHAALIAESAA